MKYRIMFERAGQWETLEGEYTKGAALAALRLYSQGPARVIDCFGRSVAARIFP